MQYQVLNGLDPEYIRELESRFWAKVDQRGKDDCWNWTAYHKKTGMGYGSVMITYAARQTHRPAHRVAYELTKGPIPAGLLVLHKCDNPLCVNPNHLFTGTVKDNTQDMMQKGRSRAHYLMGSKNYRAKITEAQAIEIKNKYQPRKYGCKQLAEEYGISFQAVWLIVTGKGWKHLK